MNHGFSQMSTPPSGSSSGYGTSPPGYPMPPANQQNNTAKIVLIVLAVVFGGGILIIMILAAILFPVFQKVRGNARLSTCLSNVRQIELGMIMYAQNHNGKLPPSALDYKNAISRNGVDPQIFRCPANDGGGPNYSMNANLQGINLDKLAKPRLIIEIYEGTNQNLIFRHQGKTVVGFADGHDEALTQIQVQSRGQDQTLRWRP